MHLSCNIGYSQSDTILKVYFEQPNKVVNVVTRCVGHHNSQE
jgi:hypothetical protein